METVLRAALKAPGNRKRFLNAGVAEVRVSGGIELSADWPTRFFHIEPLDRDTVRAAPHDFLTSLSDIAYRGVTSGSRSSCFVYFAPSQWNERRLTGRRRMLAAIGISETTPIVNLASRLQPASPQDMTIIGPINREMVEAYRRYRPDGPFAVRGYPSQLTAFTAFLPPDIPSPIAIISTGEPLYTHQRATLSARFGAPVLDEYGCHECGISGYRIDGSAPFTVDESRCFPEAVEGHLVTTDLSNTVMPMIRYRCGDLVDAVSGTEIRPLGRREDFIRTRLGHQPVGKMDLPAIKGLHSYNVHRMGETIVSRVTLSEEAGTTPDWNALRHWSRSVFGSIPVEIAVASQPMEEAPAKTPVHPTVDWVTALQTKSWEKGWFEVHDPGDDFLPFAKLFRALVSPFVVPGRYGVSDATRRTLHTLAFEPPLRHPESESAGARILLLGVASLAPDDTIREEILKQARRRLAAVAPDEGMAALSVADILLPDRPTTGQQGGHPGDQKRNWDRLDIHLLLQALEFGVHRARQGIDRVPLVSSLQPLLGVLLGDALAFAGEVEDSLLWTWRAMLDRKAPIPKAMVEGIPWDLRSAWVRFRYGLSTAPDQTQEAFERLRFHTRGEIDRRRLVVEEGYGALAAGATLEPRKWLDRFNREGRLEGGDSETIDPLPWLPILRAIAPGLFNIGRRAEAYQCLVTCSASSSRISAFDRISRRINDKIPVIVDEGLMDSRREEARSR